MAEVKKQLAGMEDLMQGVGTVRQVRNGASVDVHMVDIPLALTSDTDMSALDPAVWTRARVYTATTVYTDYIYDPTSTAGIASDVGAGSWIPIVSPTASLEVHANVTAMLAADIALSVSTFTPQTMWKRIAVSVPTVLADFIPMSDVHVEDFNDGVMSVDEYVPMANDYIQKDEIRATLVFPNDHIYVFAAETSFVLYVEGSRWYCPGIAHLRWAEKPDAGFAINLRGRHDSSTPYNTRVNFSNYQPLEGFTIGQNGNMLGGSGLMIGYADERQSADGVVVTSKFTLRRLTICDFDDVVDMWNGSWAFELDHVNTIGGSWRTPDTYFTGLDFGENIKLNHCFIADNHTRTDGNAGEVKFSTGEFIIMGGSFDNMRVVVDSSANVKMTNPHFENPSSSAKNKVFVEVTGKHASCVIDNPTIVIRDTPIYSTLFFCEAGNDSDRHAWSGGLTLSNPQFSATELYRPDLAIVRGIDHGTTYEGDGFRELVGGGGRVKLVGQAYINSLYYTYEAIPVARNLIGASLSNTSFDLNAAGEAPTFWTVLDSGAYTAEALISDEYFWVGAGSLKSTVDYNGGATWHSFRAYQEIDCAADNLVLTDLKVKWVVEHTNGSSGDISGQVLVSIDFYDKADNYLSTGWSSDYDILNSDSSTYDGWETMNLVAHAPEGAAKVRIQLTAYSTSDSADKKIHTYWDGFAMNVL